MKLACVSDLHGHLPEIPDCDVLLLGGDYSPDTVTELKWLHGTFAPWIKKLSERMKVVGVAGNHEILFEQNPILIPTMEWVYLEDSGFSYQGLNFWGSPWQPRFFDWAFNADEDQLCRKWDLIPNNTDVLLLHGPPHGYGDFSNYGQEHTGSPGMTKRIEEIQPKLVIAGHIHSAYGRYQIGNTIVLNCSLVNERYQIANPIQIVEL